MRRRRESGSAAIEAAVGLPAFMLFVALVILAGRLAIATQAVRGVRVRGRPRRLHRPHPRRSRPATPPRPPASSLANQNLHCVRSTVTVDTAGFDAPVGTPAQVTATVACVVNLADLSLPGVPGTRTVTATATSPIDTYRER